MSYLVLPERVCSLYKNGADLSALLYQSRSAYFAEIYRKGYYERHLNKTRALYRSRHDVLLSTLKEMKTEFTVSGEMQEYIFFFILRWKKRKELIRLAEEKK